MAICVKLWLTIYLLFVLVLRTCLRQKLNNNWLISLTEAISNIQVFIIMNLGCDHYLECLLKSTEQQSKWAEINVSFGEKKDKRRFNLRKSFLNQIS